MQAEASAPIMNMVLMADLTCYQLSSRQKKPLRAYKQREVISTSRKYEEVLPGITTPRR